MLYFLHITSVLSFYIDVLYRHFLLSVFPDMRFILNRHMLLKPWKGPQMILSRLISSNFFYVYSIFSTFNLKPILNSRFWSNYENPSENRQIHVRSLPFLEFRIFMPEKWPLFFISRIRASHWKKCPFLEKICISLAYALLGSGGFGVRHSRTLWIISTGFIEFHCHLAVVR